MSDLESVYAEVRTCTQCLLHKGRTHAVPGEGSMAPAVLFIGEAPGFHEDQQGRPFVGAAGQFLNQLLADVGLQREQVYITNVIKCRPPANRDPLPEEIAACSAYLDRQLATLRPKLVVTLGRFSMARWFPNSRISDIHGQARNIGGVIYYPMYHPAAALHQPSLKIIVEQDMQRIPDLLAQATQIAEYEPPEEIQQLSLF